MTDQERKEPIDTVCTMTIATVGGKKQLRGVTRWELPKGASVRLVKLDDGKYALVADCGSGRKINNSPETMWAFEP